MYVNMDKDFNMKYVATYCVMGQETGSNPLEHSCLLLSKMNPVNHKLQVVAFWSFYGVPTTDPEDSWKRKLKVYLKLDVDLQGNHGMLRVEELRRLCLGRGLRGTSFQLTQEEFESLQNICHSRLAAQNAAIKEVVETQGLLSKPQEKTREYPHEHRSRLIYDLEKIKAAEQGREPRLKPFEFKLSIGLWGPHLANSHTCKSEVVALLATVLSKKQIDRLTENGNHPTVPKYSGPMERIYLHYTGPLRTHKKASGDIVHYPDHRDAGELFWTVPPQDIDALTADTFDLFYIDEEYIDEVKSIISTLQQLEQLCRDAVVPEQYQKYRSNLVARIVECYNNFAVISPKVQDQTVSGWRAFGLSLFSIPLNSEQRKLKEKIGDAKILFNSLYTAIVDDWKIVIPNTQTKTGEGVLQFTQPIKESAGDDDFEAVVAYFPTQTKIALCKLIGRNYCAPEEYAEATSIGLARNEDHVERINTLS